jgi:hypothetical protein
LKAKTKSVSERIRKELISLESAGRLTPADVVKKASDPRSPMHRYFTWDDSVAARKYREDQARALISDFTLTVKVNRTEFVMQEFVHVPNGSKQGYTSFSKVMGDNEMSQKFMIDQLKIAHGVIYKIRNYAKALGFERDVEQLTVEIDNLFAKVQAAAAA